MSPAMRTATPGCTHQLLASVLWLIALPLCSGCSSSSKAKLETTEAQTVVTPAGRIWMLPGVEGGAWSMQFACQALRDAGVKADIKVVVWERPFSPIANLADYEGNLRKAADIAEEISSYRAAHPRAPLIVIGYSGGGGLALLVAEALPTDVHLRDLILVHPAISPEYDLTTALAHVDGRLVNFHSDYDWAMLGLGTSVFGTIDRRNVPSAGKVGFDLAKAVPHQGQRRKVIQPAWDSAMISAGHIGGHFGMLTYGWNRRYVAPYLLARPSSAHAPTSE